MRNNWKDGYFKGLPVMVDKYMPEARIFYSLVGDNMEEAKSLKGVEFQSAINHILPGGHYTINNSVINLIINRSELRHICALSGQGLDESFICWDVSFKISGDYKANTTLVLEDQTILRMPQPTYESVFYMRCRIMKDAVSNPDRANKCIVYNASMANSISLSICHHNSYIDIFHTKDHKDLGRPYSLFANSTIEVTAQVLKDFSIYNHGFDDCKFKIGDGEATKLVGATEEELRADFVQRCKDAGINTSEENMKKWVFANGASTDGKIHKDSILAKYIEREGLIEGLGAFDYFVESIPIVAEGSVMPNSIGATRGKAMSSNGKALLVDKGFRADEKSEAHITSNVISFKGIKEFSKLNILDNLPHGVGVSLNAQHPIEGDGILLKEGNIDVNSFKANERYIVRPTDKAGVKPEFASFKYKGKVYSTSVVERNNVFITETEPINSADFTDIKGEPMLFAVPNAESYQAYEIRIVDEIMDKAGKEKGNLEKGYWYIVEPNSAADETGTVKAYNKNYPCYSSFLATDTSAFQANGACRLKKCFADDERKESFYDGKQKPKWFSVLGDDMRAIKKNSSIYEDELELGFDGKYIGSGHPQFYEKLNGHTGIKSVGLPIKGKYFQVRVKVTSLNLM